MTDYRNNASQRERAAALRNDQRVRNDQRNKDASTFSQFGESEAREIEGRFAAREKANVVGTTEYPGLTYGWGPNWSHDPVPPEPPLGFSVEDHEPVGEKFEVEASLGGEPTTEANPLPDQSRRPGSSPIPTATAPVSSPLVADASGPANVTTTETSRERTAQSPLVALANPKPRRGVR
jgi:hypothetical protein